MSYEIAKQLLDQALTFEDRLTAVKAAMAAGMPLAEIEEYLDWLDATRGGPPPPKSSPGAA